MPCRAARACRPVVQNPAQCLWITDEVLAEAFDRFTRVFGESRRYGSNVPGPLEARRRSAKRRMGLVSHAASASPVPEMSSLFGLGGFGTSTRQDFDKSWKWEAPTVPKAQHVTSEQHDTTWKLQWPGGGPRRKEFAWEEFLDVSHHVEVDAVEESTKAFEKLLAEKSSIGSVSAADMTEMRNFLQSTADEPAAHNTAKLMDWIGSRGIDLDADEQLSTLLLEKLQAESLETDEIAKILVSAAVNEKSELLANVLEHPFSDKAAPLCRSTTRMLLERLQPDPTSPAPAPVLLWLQCLKRSRSLQRTFWVYTSDIWRGVYSELASTYTSPAAISTHLTLLNNSNLSHILLTHWVPHLLPVENTSPQSGVRIFDPTDRGLERRTMRSASIANLKRVFDLRERVKYLTRRRWVRRNNPLIDLLLVLNQHGVPIKSLARDIMEIFCHKPPDRTFRFFRHVWYLRFLEIDMDFGVRLVHHFLAKNQAYFAYRVFDHVPGLPLSHCYQLPIKLAGQEVVHPAKIWKILRRQAPPDYLEYTARTTARLTLVPEHIDVVNLVAWQWACSRHLTSRSAFRRVWECYRFLKDRGAVISSIMTRAMVTAGAARPLLERRRPGMSKFRFIVGLVRNVEGKEVAKALDRAVYTEWSAVIREKGLHAIRNSVDRQLGKRQNGDLRKTKYRLRLWSKASDSGGDKVGLQSTLFASSARSQEHDATAQVLSTEARPAAMSDAGDAATAATDVQTVASNLRETQASGACSSPASRSKETDALSLPVEDDPIGDQFRSTSAPQADPTLLGYPTATTSSSTTGTKYTEQPHAPSASQQNASASMPQAKASQHIHLAILGRAAAGRDSVASALKSGRSEPAQLITIRKVER